MCNDNFIKLTRLLSTDQYWIEARPTHQSVFLCILLRMAFSETEQDSNGHKVKIKPFQLYISQRKLAEWSSKWITKDDVEGALRYFSRCKFLLHEVLQRKSLITVISSEICDQILKRTPPTSTTKLLLDSSIKEEREEREEDINKEIYKEKIISISSSKENPSIEIPQESRTMGAVVNQDYTGLQHNIHYQDDTHVSGNKRVKKKIHANLIENPDKVNIKNSLKIQRLPNISTSAEEHSDLILFIEEKKEYSEKGNGEEFLLLCYERLSEWKSSPDRTSKQKKEMNKYSDAGRIKKWVLDAEKEAQLKQEEIKSRERRLKNYSGQSSTSNSSKNTLDDVETIESRKLNAQKMVRENWTKFRPEFKPNITHECIWAVNDKLYFKDPKFDDLIKHYMRKWGVA